MLEVDVFSSFLVLFEVYVMSFVWLLDYGDCRLHISMVEWWF